ncbi:MAG TPA: hypothetical protein VGR26_16590 [Acidimicrobiales bacterium]|nr:hypothetical protein [Acidimicrobiales bacterium]
MLGFTRILNVLLRSIDRTTKEESHGLDRGRHPVVRVGRELDAALTQLDGAPDGMEERYIGTADDGKLRVVSLWQ